MDNIKLVIWDLDDTFWKGSLSEGGIEAIQKNIELIKELTNRGILNSIVSKNDLQKAKSKLVELEVWDYFIFPLIQFNPKGAAVKKVIERSQLRATNVLFIDDNHLNLEEAKFYNPEINIKPPDFIEHILSHKALKGKDDDAHTRLKEYKVLESKASIKDGFESNVKFLESCDIQVEFLTGQHLGANINRIVELIERTNQLNFTKVRSDLEEIESLLDNANYKTALIRVTDNYGDYRIAGFYSLHTERNELKHFVFSCRILNLGVAQYIYSKLGMPVIKVVPEVAEELGEAAPYWISEFDGKDHISHSILKNEKAGKNILFKGGCDLRQMMVYLQSKKFNIVKEDHYISEKGFPIHQEHTQIIIDSYALSPEKKELVATKEYIPFADKGFYNTEIHNGQFDCIAISVLMDYTQELYVHKTENITLPFGSWDQIWTDENRHEAVLEKYGKRKIPIEKELLKEFSEQFEHVGKISPEAFVENLKKIRSLISLETPIVFMNGAEVDSPSPLEVGAKTRHEKMNKALDQFIATSDNTHLLDVRQVVDSASQLTNHIRHYSRESYKDLSIDFLVLLNKTIDNNISTNLGFNRSMIEFLKINFPSLHSYLKSKRK
ncbi:MAG: hypothetical protein HRT71_09145 [Flavobacteriales bacterium]|nr:hypothetical protein [Flavobacteriales bacterium]